MEPVQFLFALVIDGLVMIAAGALWRWAMPERFTVRRLLIVTAAVAIFITAYRVLALH